MHHVWRVFRLGQRFADELDAELEVVGCTALTHDLHRALGEGTGCDPEETLEKVRRILEDAGVADEGVPAVQHCVAVHDDLAFRGEEPTPETLEAEVLRDADNLDAMGAVGVARTFAFGSVHGTPPWDPDGEEYSRLYHLEDKLLRLREELHTALARELAAERPRVPGGVPRALPGGVARRGLTGPRGLKPGDPLPGRRWKSVASPIDAAQSSSSEQTSVMTPSTPTARSASNSRRFLIVQGTTSRPAS